MISIRTNGIISRLFFFFLLFFLPTKFLTAQNYFFDNYSVAEGMAQSTVFSILQDHNDYIWLGTREGASRFDGKEFINYSLENGMAGNGVRVIYQDSANNIWFGHSGGGISIYDGHNFRVFSKPGTIFNSDITGIESDADHNIWITTELSGAVKIKAVNDSLSLSEYKLYIGNDLSDRVFGIYKTRDENLFFITDSFLKQYDPASDKFTSYHREGMPTFFLITCMYEDLTGDVWYGTHNGGLYRFMADSGKFMVYDVRDGLASNWITRITGDKTGNIWVGTWGGGLTLIQPEGLKIIDTSNGLKDLKIRTILEDREGNVLIGTNENGLAIFKGFQFLSYLPEDGLIDPQVWSILQDSEGTIWMGTSKGISLLDQNKNEIKDFDKLKDTRILFLKKDAKSRIWIGTDNQGVYTYDRTTSQFSYERNLNSLIPPPTLTVTALETDPQSKLWAGTLDRLIVYDYDTRDVNIYTQTNGLNSNEITALHYAPSGKMWIGSRGQGLNFFYKDSIYKFPLDLKFTATSINSDEEGKLWVGTEARGLFQIDPEKKEIIKNYRESDGLLANLINLIISDENDRVYIGTNRGLNVIEKNSGNIYAYNHKNGFTGIETKPGSGIVDKDGDLWFGTIKGVTRLQPDLLDPGSLDPLTHIIGFKVNREDRDMTPGLELSYRENDIEFEYISICLENPEAVAYQIMLEGTDNNWRPVTNQKRVIYPKLAPNTYTFKVKGRNSSGIWNEEPISYTFRIKPPFYKTSWFILLCIMMGTAIIITYIKIRERNLIREKKILENKVQERTAEVVAQKEELAEKNKDITDSIVYAKRIQDAILPHEIPFKNTFLFFKPKDIVSGDFYWFEELDDLEFIAAVDCTGHGVPGAFMSIIGTNLLNKIVKEHHILEPAQILNRLNDELIFSLKSSGEEAVYDGMDLALVCFNKKTNELQYAGGYNPLVLIKDKELTEIKANRFAIGRLSGSQEQSRNFTNHTIKVTTGDSIYIFSDGYADQFGGEKGKKFKTKPLRELLYTISDEPVERQQEILDSTLNAWKGDIKQVDDILIIGRKF